MNMTPMIDIVFLLIIFYISVYQITHVNEERVQLSQQAGAEDKEKTRLTFTVREDGMIRHDGRDISLADSVLLVGEQLQEAGNDPQSIVILIRGDRRGNSQAINEMVREFGELGLEQIRLAVETRQ